MYNPEAKRRGHLLNCYKKSNGLAKSRKIFYGCVPSVRMKSASSSGGYLRCVGDRMAGILPGYGKIVEQRIREAMDRGEFENLPGKGKPIPLEDDSHVPEDLRLAYKLLKNADCLPPELLEKKEILQMEDMLTTIPDEKERYKLIKKINFKIMKLNVMGKKSPLLEEKQIYYKKLVDKIASK